MQMGGWPVQLPDWPLPLTTTVYPISPLNTISVCFVGALSVMSVYVWTQANFKPDWPASRGAHASRCQQLGDTNGSRLQQLHRSFITGYSGDPYSMCVSFHENSTSGLPSWGCGKEEQDWSVRAVPECSVYVYVGANKSTGLSIC